MKSGGLTVIMSDWNTTLPEDGSIPWVCVAAGNDIITQGIRMMIKTFADAYKKNLQKKKSVFVQTES